MRGLPEDSGRSRCLPVADTPEIGDRGKGETEMAFQRKSQEERDAEIASLKATLDSAIERLAQSPEQWVEFLDVVAHFAANYSFGNQLLILVQAAERGFSPTMIRPYGSRDRANGGKPRSGWAGGWLGLGRNVIKGQTGLKIWRPILRRMTEEEHQAHIAKGGKPLQRVNGKLPKRLVGWGIARVFDISQTEGEPVEVETTTVTRRVRAAGGVRPELLTGDDTTGELETFIRLVKAEEYTFERVSRTLLGGANGRTSGTFRTVQVRDDVDDAQAVKTTVHELAHILCGHVDPGFDYVAHRGRAETEAESVAYIVCGALGLDTEQYSAPYVATWAEGDMALVRASADRIVKVSKEILSHFTDTEEATQDDDSE